MVNRGVRKYRAKYGHICMNPDCAHGFDIEVHHIVPKACGGKDRMDNFIALCKKCHDLVSEGKGPGEIELRTYKYYAEASGADEWKPRTRRVVCKARRRKSRLSDVSVRLPILGRR